MSKKITKKEKEYIEADAANNDFWEKSPITKREEVLVEFDDANGETRFCIGSGFYTNAFPLNYKENPDFDINTYEAGMPALVKELRFDDGEKYWYPTTIQTHRGMIFPTGTKEEYKWAFAPVNELTEEEKASSTIDASSKIDMAKMETFDRFLDASKKIRGVYLDELPQ